MDRDKIFRLSSPEIRVLIIDVLKKRPAFSIKRDGLSKEILRSLGVDIRREARKKFEGRVLRVAEALKNEKIIKEYKAKNVRFKLINTYEFPHLKKMNNDSLQNQFGDVLLDKEKDEEGFDEDIEIPDIPDQIFEDENTEDDDNGIPYEEKPMKGFLDPEIERLVDIFLNEDSTDLVMYGRDSPNVSQNINPLQIINDCFNKDIRVQSQLTLNRIALSVETNSGKIAVLINLNELSGEISISSLIPYLEDAYIDAVRFCSTTNFKCSLSVEGSQGQLYFSVKDAMLYSKDDSEKIIERVKEVISASIKIDEIIDGYL